MEKEEITISLHKDILYWQLLASPPAKNSNALMYKWKKEREVDVFSKFNIQSRTTQSEKSQNLIT